MPLQHSLPIDLFLSLLLRCSCADLLRLQQCSHAFYDLLHSDRCVDYLLRQHCRLTASQLANFSLSLNQVTPQQPVDFLFRLLPCLASVEVHSLASHTLPPLHRAVLVEAVLHSSLSTSDLSVLHEQPTSLLPWLDTPDSPLLRLQLQEIVDLAHHADKLTLHSLHLPDICLWLRPQAACWRQSWDEYWMAAMHTASHHNKERQQAEEDRDGKEAAADDDDAKSEYDERSAWMSSTLERLADKRHIGQQLDQRVLWIGHIQQSVCQPPAVFGYFLGHVQHRQHRVPATIHHNDYTLHAAYSDTTPTQCADRLTTTTTTTTTTASTMNTPHLDLASLPVVVADLTGSLQGVNGTWLRVYESLSGLLASRAGASGRERDGEVVRSFIEQVHAAHGGSEDDMDVGLVDAAATAADRLSRLPLYLRCFPGADRPQWIE